MAKQSNAKRFDKAINAREVMRFKQVAGTEHMTSDHLMSLFEPLLEPHLTTEHRKLLAQSQTTSLVQNLSSQDEVWIGRKNNTYINLGPILPAFKEKLQQSASIQAASPTPVNVHRSAPPKLR